MSNEPYKKSDMLTRRLCKNITVCFLGILFLSLCTVFICFNVFPRTPNDLTVYDRNYDVAGLDDSKENRAIKYGYAIFNNSPRYLGPDSISPNRNFSGNGLSCKNCHLGSGTKPYAAPLIGIIQRFPQYRGRENKIGTIEERINGCMERSMNGRAMPEDNVKMQSLIAYLDWLGRYAPKDGKIEGQGFVNIDIPDRAVDLNHGKTVFTKHCIACHGSNGQGTPLEDGAAYTYPPLWGDDSYNNGAGMTRVITAAQFIKANMPFGTTYKNPVLTDEEAYDVAGYINQQVRPGKKNLELDFPDLRKKPVSTPYPPYTDTFSIEQHQLGPFRPIMEYYKKAHNIKKTK